MKDVVDSMLQHIDHSRGPLCFHIGTLDVFATGEMLVQQLHRRGDTAAFAHMFVPRSRWLDRFVSHTAAAWFARAARCSRREALDRIASLPLQVHRSLACNAGNPRCLLAVAAAAYRSPEVLIYTCSGMDPAGARTLQAEIFDLCTGTRPVHLQTSRRQRDRQCVSMRPMTCVVLR